METKIVFILKCFKFCWVTEESFHHYADIPQN